MIPARRTFIPFKRDLRRVLSQQRRRSAERLALGAVLMTSVCLFYGNWKLLHDENSFGSSSNVRFEVSAGRAVSLDIEAPKLPFSNTVHQVGWQDVRTESESIVGVPGAPLPGNKSGSVSDMQQPLPPIALVNALCSVTEPCSVGTLPVRLASAARGETPRACVNGQELLTERNMKTGLAVVELSLSAVVVATNTFEITSGASELDDLQRYIESVKSGHLLLFVTADVAFDDVGDAARLLLHRTGSGYAYRLSGRRGWVMATVKGLTFTTHFEAVSEPGPNGEWEESAQIATCVPLLMDQRTTGYHSRMEFCKQFNRGEPSDYGHFCTADGVKEYLLPQPLLGSQLHSKEKTLALQLPVAILARHDRPAYLQQCLHSFLAQPGLNTAMLTVFFDGYNLEAHSVASFYSVRSLFFRKTKSHSSMKDVFRRADEITAHYARVLPLVFQMFSSVDEAIVIEEDHIVSPDFLLYFSQLLPILRNDNTLLTISAYNDNGYEHTAQDSGAVYRSEFFPGRAWLLQRHIWDEWKETFPKCCSGWSWDLWIREQYQRKGRETLIPDVPRVHHIGQVGSQVSGMYWQEYFKSVALNTVASSSLHNVEKLSSSAYEEHLDHLIRTALLIEVKDKKCGPDLVPESFGMRYVLYYAQDLPTDFSQLTKLLKCFRLWDLGIRGLHRGLFRFYCKYNHIMLIGSKTRYAELHMPQQFEPYQYSARNI